MKSFREQVRSNAVALISLSVALLSLGYNTWRNETTERQRNIRHAAFLLIEHSGRLQSVANGMVYAGRHDAWVDGWGEALSIQSLGQLMPAPVPERSDAVFSTWEAEFRSLERGTRDEKAAADQRMQAAISALNEAVVDTIANLD